MSKEKSLKRKKGPRGSRVLILKINVTKIRGNTEIKVF